MCFGYLINDYYDIITDRVNKPGKNIFDGSQTLQYKVFMWFSFAIGIVIPITGFLRHYDWIGLLFIYLFAAAGLFFYAYALKNTVFIGNFLIALLSGLAIVVPPNIRADDASLSAYSFSLIPVYGLFAFLITLVREIVKDAEDIAGDRTAKIKTIATVYGAKTSVYFSAAVMVGCVMLLLTTGYYFYGIRYIPAKAVAFFILAVCGLIPFFKIVRATEKKHFSGISSLLKLWMLLGIISMWI